MKKWARRLAKSVIAFTISSERENTFSASLIKDVDQYILHLYPKKKGVYSFTLSVWLESIRRFELSIFSIEAGGDFGMEFYIVGNYYGRDVSIVIHAYPKNYKKSFHLIKFSCN